jgi:hypothetical protein
MNPAVVTGTQTLRTCRHFKLETVGNDGASPSSSRYDVSNVRQKGEYKSETAASLTLAELERWLALEMAVLQVCSRGESLRR